jgi:hypothetical protein
MGRKRGVGKMNSRPALAFAAAEFRANKVGAPSNFHKNLKYYLRQNLQTNFRW